MGNAPSESEGKELLEANGGSDADGIGLDGLVEPQQPRPTAPAPQTPGNPHRAVGTRACWRWVRALLFSLLFFCLFVVFLHVPF